MRIKGPDLDLKSNWWMYAVGIAGLPIIILFGWFIIVNSGDKLNGTVTYLEDKPPYTYVTSEPTYMRMCSYDSKGNSTCQQYLIGYHDVQHYVAECFYIRVEGEHSGDRCLRKERWAGLKVGDQYVGEDVK